MRKNCKDYSESRTTFFQFLFMGIQVIFCASIIQAQTIAVPDGYAGYKGTTGGGDATADTVTSLSELKAAVENDIPAVIVVDGRINTGGGNISFGSNKTVVGANSSSGIYGGTIKIQGSNYIIQNLTFGPSGEDVMEASGATNVFVTKCSFYDSQDELFSIVRAADFVTVSWCKFYFENPTSHSFAHLIGNSDDRTSDRGKLHVTMHHNWYAENVLERMPRVRFGHVHIYNNYYNSVGNHYCIGTGVECHIRLENAYFDNVNLTWKDYNGVSSGGIMGWHNLKLINCSMPTYITNSYPAFTLPYNYVLDPVDSVKAIVTAGAGNVFGAAPGDKTIQVSITSPGDHDTLADHSDITIDADASVSVGTIDSVLFYHGNELIGSSINEPYSIVWEDVAVGNYKIIAIAIDNEGTSAVSDIINITVEEELTIGNMHRDTGLDLALFPNPVSRDLEIRLKSNLSGKTHITLYNARGRILAKDSFSGDRHIFHLEEFPAGVYFIRIRNDHKYDIRRIIKM